MHFSDGGDPIVFAAQVEGSEDQLTMEMVVATVQNPDLNQVGATPIPSPLLPSCSVGRACGLQIAQ